MVKFYADKLGNDWQWQSVDSGIRSAPLGGDETGKNPTDRGKQGSKIHAVEEVKYVPHIKHRRRRNEPLEEECPIPGEKQSPARRWVVERTIGWLGKRRGIRTRWCKNVENWYALIKFACAHILFKMAFYGWAHNTNYIILKTL